MSLLQLLQQHSKNQELIGKQMHKLLGGIIPPLAPSSTSSTKPTSNSQAPAIATSPRILQKLGATRDVTPYFVAQRKRFDSLRNLKAPTHPMPSSHPLPNDSSFVPGHRRVQSENPSPAPSARSWTSFLTSPWSTITSTSSTLLSVSPPKATAGNEKPSTQKMLCKQCRRDYKVNSFSFVCRGSFSSSPSVQCQVCSLCYCSKCCNYRISDYPSKGQSAFHPLLVLTVKIYLHV